MKLFFFFLFTFNCFARSPYDLAKFKSVLSESKLKAPNSKTVACPQGKFSGYESKYFHLNNLDDFITFKIQGKAQRAELRQMREWKTSSSQAQIMQGEIKVIFPATSSLNELTFMQIHASNPLPNKPLLRLA